MNTYQNHCNQCGILATLEDIRGLLICAKCKESLEKDAASTIRFDVSGAPDVITIRLFDEGMCFLAFDMPTSQAEEFFEKGLEAVRKKLGK